MKGERDIRRGAAGVDCREAASKGILIPPRNGAQFPMPERLLIQLSSIVVAMIPNKSIRIPDPEDDAGTFRRLAWRPPQLLQEARPSRFQASGPLPAHSQAESAEVREAG